MSQAWQNLAGLLFVSALVALVIVAVINADKYKLLDPEGSDEHQP